ncbi:hypothetical protein GCM10027273_31400 [Nocardioides pakistanensis]
MDTGPARSSFAASPSGRLLALLAAAAFLLAALTGNSFPLHVGMTAGAPESTVAADMVTNALAGSGAVLERVHKVAPATAMPMPVGSEAQHLMHLVGACLAVLAAAALLLRLLLQRRSLLGSHPAVIAVPRPLTPRRGGLWSPPPPSPPTSSPVIRT